MNSTENNPAWKDLFENLWFKWIGGLILGAAGFLMAYPLRSAMDIFFLDETGYLIRGLNMFPKIPKLWGPVYCFWYKLLSLIQSNPVDLFYLNFGLMSILLGLGLYLFLIRFKVSWPVAFWLSFMVLISPLNLTTFPKVSHFAALFGMAGLMTAYFIKQSQNRYLFMALVFLIMSYIRPEFYLAFLICSIGIVIGWSTKRIRFNWSAILIGGLIVAVVLHIGLGIPLGTEIRGYKRSFVAFGEHFSWNYSKWNGLRGYLWLTWESVTASAFGDSKSFSAAAFENPSMMFRHITYNFGIYLRELHDMLVMSILPAVKVSMIYKIFAPALIFILLLLKPVRRDYIKRLRHHRALFVFLGLIALPSILSCLIIYPRPHYIIIQLPLWIWLLAELLSTVIRKISSLRLKQGLLGLIGILSVLYFLNPRQPANYEYFEMRKTEGVFNNLKTLRLLDRNASVLSGKRLLSHEGNFSRFTNAKIDFVNALEKGEQPFTEFLSEVDPDMIYCTQTIFNNPNYMSDQDWINFIEDQNEQRNAWKYVSINGGDQEFLLVKAELFNQLNARVRKK